MGVINGRRDKKTKQKKIAGGERNRAFDAMKIVVCAGPCLWNLFPTGPANPISTGKIKTTMIDNNRVPVTMYADVRRSFELGPSRTRFFRALRTDKKHTL